MNPILASSLPMKKFLDPENYTAPLHGKLIVLDKTVYYKDAVRNIIQRLIS